MPSNRQITFPWFAVLLILAGAALLLDKLAVVEFGFVRIVWSAAVLFGLFRAVDGFTHNRSGSIFGGTVIFFYGLYFFFSTFDLIETQTHMFVAVSFLILGAAFLMVYFNRTREWMALLFSVVFLGLGSASVLGHFRLYDIYDVWWSVRRYWPVVLIIIGVSMIVKSRVKRQKPV